MVEDGMSRICRKLLLNAQADDKQSDGTVEISPGFMKKGAELEQQRMEAPERVHPRAGNTIAESLAKMNESRTKLEELRPLFETYDGNTLSFRTLFSGTSQHWNG